MLRELNNEAVLILYFADELPPEDRAEVERMLQSDPGLRKELARLESAVESFEAAIMAADARPLAAETAALHRIGVAMRQHVAQTAEIAAAPRAAAPTVTLKYPWWMYPAIGTAAAVVIAVSWWGSRPIDHIKISPLDPNPHRSPADPGKYLANANESEMLDSIDSPNPTIPKETVASLDDLQDKVAEISRSRPIPYVGDDSE